MIDPPGQLAQGSIVWASVRDKNGVLKRRPVLVITASDEILLDQPIVAVAITTTYGHPAPASVIELPWTHTGHPATRLRRRSAAVCDWLVVIRPGDVGQVVGYLPRKWLERVLSRVQELGKGR